MTEDPIVQEIRRARQSIAKAQRYNPHRLADSLKKLEKEHKRKLVSSPNIAPRAA